MPRAAHLEALRLARRRFDEAHLPDSALDSVRVAEASERLRDQWGALNAAPGRTIRCPGHEDHYASLSIARDDKRAWCHAPECVLCNDGRGRGTYELRKLAAEWVAA